MAVRSTPAIDAEPGRSPEALIEEARRRQRRRRTLTIFGAVCVVAATVWVLNDRGSTGRGGRSPNASLRSPSRPGGTRQPVGHQITYLGGERYGGPSVLTSFDPVSGRVGKAIQGISSVTVAPGGRMALSVDTNANRVNPVDLADGHVGKAIRVGLAPVAVAFTPDGRSAYVADAGEAAYAAQPPIPSRNRPSDSITPINLRDDRPGPPITVCQGPTALAVSAATHLLVVACGADVSLVDTTTGRPVKTLDVGGGIVTISPSGDEAVVGDTQIGDGVTSSGSIVPIDLRTATAGRPISIGGDLGDGGTANLVFAPGDNRYVYATTYRSTADGTSIRPVVLRVDLATRTVSPLRFDGDLVSDAYFWPNGEAGYVAAETDNGNPTHYRVGVSRHTVGHTVKVNVTLELASTGFAAQAPYLIALHQSREVTVVNLATGATRIIPIPFFPDDVQTS